jgi:DNA adenine methylase
MEGELMLRRTPLRRTAPLRAPFPWFGGKSRAAELIWSRFGSVPNYVEPFAGSLAVLLARQDAPGTETVNDLDTYLANFWRAVQAEPDAVAAAADWPVNEADLHARHRWLFERAEFRERMKREPEFYDAKIAGWWAWGCASWIGTGWCRVSGDGPPLQLPHLGDAGRGLHRKLPHLGDAGRGDVIRSWFGLLSERLARVRVACGDWQRILGPSVTEKHGLTAVLLDPPYSTDEHAVEYGDGHDVADAVRVWAIENGVNPMLRIALCGYEDEHDMPESWQVVEWKAQGGYGSQGDGRGRENSTRERIWFSPYCLNPADRLPFYEPRGRSVWEEGA